MKRVASGKRVGSSGRILAVSRSFGKTGGSRVRGNWWICWYCTLGHKHRGRIGPKALAHGEAERRRLPRAPGSAG